MGCTGSQVVRRNAGDTAFECATVSGTGDVVGPASSTSNGVPRFNGTGGKTLANTNVTIGTDDGLNLAAGTTTMAPLKMQSGTNMTTPSAGAFEFDGKVSYFSPVASARGVLQATQYISLTSTYTLTSQTAAQKLFNSSTNGALNAEASTTYDFECVYSLTSMGIASASFGFAIGGTATLTSIMWTSSAIKPSNLATQASWTNTFNTTAANTALTAANANTNGAAMIRGVIRVNAAGTIIPQVSLGTAAAAVVGVNSYCKLTPMGSNTMTNVGNFQ